MILMKLATVMAGCDQRSDDHDGGRAQRGARSTWRACVWQQGVAPPAAASWVACCDRTREYVDESHDRTSPMFRAISDGLLAFYHFFAHVGTFSVLARNRPTFSVPRPYGPRWLVAY